jgi:hypothetical protein
MHPALRRDLHPAPDADRVWIVHNQGDHAVVAGGLLNTLLGWMAPEAYSGRPWGQMGQDGYQGTAQNVVNYDTGDAGKWNPTACGHSDEFSDDKAEYFLGYLSQIATIEGE